MSNSEQRGGLSNLFGDIFGKDAATNTTSGSNHDEESATSPGIVQDDWSIAPGDAKKKGDGFFWTNIVDTFTGFADGTTAAQPEREDAEDGSYGSQDFDTGAVIPGIYEIEAMPIKELRALIEQSGLSDGDCVERPELVTRAVQARGRLLEAARLRDSASRGDNGNDAGYGGMGGVGQSWSAASKAAARVAAMDGRHPKRRLGDFECIVVGEEALESIDDNHDEACRRCKSPDFIVFCFHGYQAYAAQLATLAEVIRASVASANNANSNEQFTVYIVLPQSDGLGWWDINFAEYMFAMAMGEAEKARVLRQTPSGVPECRRRISRLVRETRALYADGGSEWFRDPAVGGVKPRVGRAATARDTSPASVPVKSWSMGSRGTREECHDGGEDFAGNLLNGIQSMVGLGSKTAEQLEEEDEENWRVISGGKPMFPTERVFFMGFSQGAMLAMDTALHMRESPLGGMVLVSGFLMDIEKWAQLLQARHSNIRALQVSVAATIT